MKCKYGIIPQYSKGCCCENCQEGIIANELQTIRMIQLHFLWYSAYEGNWDVSIIKYDGHGIFLRVRNKKEQMSNDCI